MILQSMHRNKLNLKKQYKQNNILKSNKNIILPAESFNDLFNHKFMNDMTLKNQENWKSKNAIFKDRTLYVKKYVMIWRKKLHL